MINNTMRTYGATRSGIRALFEFGQQRAAIVGRDNVFDFSIGNPSVPCPEAVTDALKRLLESDPVTVHAYTSSQGLPATRSAVAAHLSRRYELPVDGDDIIMTCGAAAAITTTIRALTESERDQFIVQAPYFAEYDVFIEGQGAQMTVLPPGPDFDINLDALVRALTPETKAIILNSPNNPSGHVATRDTLIALASHLTEASARFGHPIVILSDEPYRDILYDDEVAPYIPTIYPHTIVAFSLSKSLSLPGERIGYIHVPQSIACQRDIVFAILGALRAMGYVCAPALFQRALIETIDVKPNLEPYRINRELLSQGLKRAGYEIVEPKGAFYLFVKAPGGDAVAFSERAKTKDVLVVPGDCFGCPGYIRISYCVKTDTIARALPRFAELMHETHD